VRHLNVLARVVAAREELAAGNTSTADYILEDLENDIEEWENRSIRLDDVRDVPDMSL
jgi:hypothetical protein